jgi:hypothetical protein
LKADKTFHHRAYLAQQQHQKLKGEYNISPWKPQNKEKQKACLPGLWPGSKIINQ